MLDNIYIVMWRIVTIDADVVWWLNLFHTLIQRATTLYGSLLQTHASVHSHVFTAVAW
jgi:hypothetical protein